MELQKKASFARFVSAVYRGTIGYLFFVILAALLFLSAVSTSFIIDTEKIYYLPDSIFINLFLLVLTLAACLFGTCCARRYFAGVLTRIEEDTRFFKSVRRCMLCAVWIMASLYALCTQLPSGGDQITVLNAAYGLARRDFSALSPVNYLYDYNHQIGLAMVESLLNRVIGEYNYTAYHLINAILVALIHKNISELGGIFGLGRVGQLILILLCMGFVPIMLYVPFIYGTLPGLLLSLAAIKLEMRYFHGGKWWEGLLSALLISFAVLLKSNYQIFMIGMLIYAIIEVIRSKKWNKSIIVPFIVVLFVVQAILPIHIFSQMRGAGIPKGVSKWAWVTMGMQEGDNAGWYNGYTLDTLIGSEFDTERQEVWVKSDLKERIVEFLKDPYYARDFFVRKTASQWNEPTFQSVQISQNKELGSSCQWPSVLLSPEGNHAVTVYLNYLDFIVLAGAMLYILMCSKTSCFHDSLILALIIIGGFLFHMVWEAKGQYTLPYFVLLLPYTILGYSEATKRVMGMISAVKDGTNAVMVQKKDFIWKIILFVITILLLWFIFHGTIGSLTGDSEIYFNYLSQHA